MLGAPASGRGCTTSQEMGSLTTLFNNRLLPNCATGAPDQEATRTCFSWTSQVQKSSTTVTSRTYWLQKDCWTLTKFSWRRMKHQWNWSRNMLRAMSFSLSNFPSPWLRWETSLHWQVPGERLERVAGRLILELRYLVRSML